MKLSAKLKDIIYKYNGIILIETKDLGTIFKEIESIRNGSKIEGYIFRPGFADSVEFKKYTNEDFMAIYAQWSLSFGWSGLFQWITDINPQTLLDDYLKDSVFKNISPLITEEKTPVVKEMEYINELAKTLMESKIVLTSHQKEILDNIPTDILLNAYNTSVFSIREIRTKVVSKLMEEDKTFNPFNSVQDIIPLLIENFSIKDTFNLEEGEMLNKYILRDVKIKVPSNIKRKVLETLSKEYKNIYSMGNFKKYQNFWKKVLRQIIIKSFDKTVSQYPEFKNVHNIVYSNIKTNNTIIEGFKKEGMLEEAFQELMKSPGNLARNIMFYLRNKKGKEFPEKFIPVKRVIKEEKVFNTLADIMRMEGIPQPKTNSPKVKIKVSVKTDIKSILKSEEFAKYLTNVNPKLLMQLKGLLLDKRYYEDQTFKIYNRRKIKYSSPVPAIKKKWAKKLIELVNNAYQIIKKKENEKLGKIYIDESLKELKVTYSGRLDTSTNTSGVYLPIGSKIKIDKILDKDTILRFGVSWRSPEDKKDLSICIDPSINIMNGKFSNKIVNWQDATLMNNNEIIVSSSGDITQCSFNTWSTELMDIDNEKMRDCGSTRMFTTVINYSKEGNLSEVDTHIFFNVIKKEDRIIDGRQVSISLDEMDYSYKIIDKTQGQIGLLFDLEEGTVEVLKILVDNITPGSNANDLDDKFKELIENQAQLLSVYDSIINAIENTQIVDDKNEADLILDNKTDNTIITNILF